MARPDKVAAVADVKERFESSAAMLLTNYRGLTVPELQQLRAELRKSSATYRVGKNTLIRRAMADAGVEGLDDMLVGPTALVFCADDPVGPAKAIKAFGKDHPDLEFKGAWFDGEVMDADEAIKLADLESREDLLAKLAGLMYGALANTARLLQALPEKQARLMQALVDAGAGAPDGVAGATPGDEADDAGAGAPDGVAGATPGDEADDAGAGASDGVAGETEGTDADASVGADAEDDADDGGAGVPPEAAGATSGDGKPPRDADVEDADADDAEAADEADAGAAAADAEAGEDADEAEDAGAGAPVGVADTTPGDEAEDE